MGDKIFYGEEWVGLTADTRAGIYFKMDKDGKLGYVPDDSEQNKNKLAGIIFINDK